MGQVVANILFRGARVATGLVLGASARALYEYTKTPRVQETAPEVEQQPDCEVQERQFYEDSMAKIDEDFAKMPWVLQVAAKQEPIGRRSAQFREHVHEGKRSVPELRAEAFELCGNYSEFVDSGSFKAEVAKQQPPHQPTMSFCQQLEQWREVAAKEEKRQSARG